MRDFARPDMGEKTVVNLNKVIENSIILSQSEWKSVAAVETDFDPSLPAVSCLTGEMNEVFLNLMINAAHAVEQAGHKADGNKGSIAVSTRRKDDFVEIRFRDNGCGIPESIQHRIFEPFFTTKEVGRGIGQGLNVSYRVITELHGGSMDFITEEGKGTTFTIRIPI